MIDCPNPDPDDEPCGLTACPECDPDYYYDRADELLDRLFD